MKASEITEPKVIPTGLTTLDDLLGGGFFLGRVAMLSGLYSCGKSTLAALVVAEAQRQGLDTCWLDAEGRFNPTYYASLGIDLKKLDYERGMVAEDYFRFIHKWFSKHTGVLVLDSVWGLMTQNESEKDDGPSVPEVPKMLPTFLKKVSIEIGVKGKESAFILINHERTDFMGKLKVIGGHAVEHIATQWLRMRKLAMEPIKRGNNQIGDTIEISAKKDKAQFSKVKLALYPNVGFRPVDEKKPPKNTIE